MDNEEEHFMELQEKEKGKPGRKSKEPARGPPSKIEALIMQIYSNNSIWTNILTMGQAIDHHNNEFCWEKDMVDSIDSMMH